MNVVLRDLDALEHQVALTLNNEQLANIQIKKYFTVVSLSILLYDYLLTLPEELHLVWPSSLGISKVLYYVNRYLVMVEVVFLIWATSNDGQSYVCRYGFEVVGYLAAFGYIIAELILMMRTWAIWDRSRKITVLLSAILVVDIIGFILTQIYYDKGISFTPALPNSITGLQHAAGCRVTFSNRIIGVEVALVIFTEAVLLVLLIRKASQQFQDSRSRLMIIIYNDGLIFFGYVLVTSIINLVTILAAPFEVHNILITLQRVLHSVFCTRVLLHIRSAFAPQDVELGSHSDSNDVGQETEHLPFEHLTFDRPIIRFDNMSPAFRAAYLRNRATAFRASLVGRRTTASAERPERERSVQLPRSGSPRFWESDSNYEAGESSISGGGETIKMQDMGLPSPDRLDGDSGANCDSDKSRDLPL